MRVVGRSLALAATGLAIGMVVAAGTTRLLATLRFRVATGDPLTYLGVASLLASITALASYLPARRASRVGPLVALRG